MLAIVNPTAAGGRCGARIGQVLERLATTVEIERVDTTGPGHAMELAREGYRAGHRSFLSVGGDGTAFELVNGLMGHEERIALGFVPLGTGNSFLRDFTSGPLLDHAVASILAGKRRPCDILRLRHRAGVTYSINYVSLGFPADVGAVTNRRFKAFGRLGYILGVVACLASLPRPTFPVRLDGGDLVSERCLFLTFANSKYTGGKMMIAPDARTDDGLIEHVRMGPIGRLTLLRYFPRLFDGTYVQTIQATRQPVTRAEFTLDGPVDVMIDGEVVRLHCEALDILPGALDVIA